MMEAGTAVQELRQMQFQTLQRPESQTGGMHWGRKKGEVFQHVFNLKL